MKSIYTIIVGLLMSICLFQSWQTKALFELTEGKVAFESSAPLEVILAESGNLKGVIDPITREFAFAVNINSFEGFNSPLQKEHFNENYLESSHYSRGSYSGRIIERINLLSNGTFEVRTKGKLEIHGVKLERIIKSKVEVKDGKLFVHSDFTVPLKDHNIPIPKIVNQKIAEDIKVTVDAIFELKKK